MKARRGAGAPFCDVSKCFGGPPGRGAPKPVTFRYNGGTRPYYLPLWYWHTSLSPSSTVVAPTLSPTATVVAANPVTYRYGSGT